MPSPFPGMDPLLEHPDYFPDLHDSLIVYLTEFLQPRLPECHYASVSNRAWVEVSRRFVGPDMVHVPDDERRESFIEVRTRQDGNERLVTHVEILSLTNKTPGEHGRDLYLRKQQEILSSRTHLVEIDLLRAGTHTSAVPPDRARERTGPFDYHVCVHQFDNLEDYFVYPVQLSGQLPEIAVPLLPGDGGVAIDLQAVFERCYETGPYRRRVRYAQDAIVPPLDAERSAWMMRVLRENGLAPPTSP